MGNESYRDLLVGAVRECDDAVYHPRHYTSATNGIECIDAIFAALERYKNPVDAWLVGQIIKYLWRAPLKGKYKEDICKAEFYMQKLIDSCRTNE